MFLVYTVLQLFCIYNLCYRGADKSLAWPGRKQVNVSLGIAWISFGALPCRKKKKTWWQLASRCCWNRVHPWHASELVPLLVWLRTYEHPGTCNVILPVKYVLYFYVSTFRNVCAVHGMAVFCSSLISCFPGALLRYCPSDFEMVPFIPIVTGIIFTFTFHMCWISVMRFSYLKIFSASFLFIITDYDV